MLPMPATPAGGLSLRGLPEPAVPQNLRAFSDTGKTRELIFGNALTAAKSVAPIANRRYTLSLRDPHYADDRNYTKKEQKNAILGRQTLGWRLRGTWDLTDNATGQVVDSKKTLLGTVPYLTDSGTFILDGTKYILRNQQRLRPGIFTRQKENGELESHINVLPGKGFSHHYMLDPAKEVFRMRVGQAQLPLLPLLRALGANDAELRGAWGDEIFAANRKEDTDAGMKKVYDRLVRNPDPHADQATRVGALRELIESMELDPEVTRRTLRQSFPRLNKQAILAATQKLLSVHRGEAESDDRDALPYQQFVGPEDLFAERLKNDAGGVRRNLLNKLTFRGNLKALPAGALAGQILSAIRTTGLGASPEEVNPLELLDKQSQVTRMGAGGIPSLDSIPDDARGVQPSYFGFIDPVRTPECYAHDMEVYTQDGWKFWPDVREQDELACQVAGRLEFHRPERLLSYDYSGPMYGVRAEKVEYLVTPDHRNWTCPIDCPDSWRFVFASDMHERPRCLQIGGHLPLLGADAEWFDLPRPKYGNENNIAAVDRVPVDDWAELCGWIIGEGNTVFVENGKTQYRVDITQSPEANPDNCLRLAALLNRLPFRWFRRGRLFCLSTKQLAAYFKPLGKSSQKFIPPELFRLRVSARQRLFDALLLGEGRRDRRDNRTQFCTSSQRLADDFAMLAFSLGHSTKISFEPDSRPQSTTGGCFVVHVHTRTKRQLRKRYRRTGKNAYFIRHYTGKVYCATVPGGLLYVRRGEGGGHWSGNSLRAGVDSNFATNAYKGTDGRLYAGFLDARSGKPVYKSPQDLADAIVAFPEALKSPSKRIPALSAGRLQFVPRKDVDYVLPHFEKAFSALGNLVPMKSAAKAQRMAMAARMLTQALPLQKAEAPLVQSGVPDREGRSYEEEYGKSMGAIFADKPSTVVNVTPDEITLRTQDGQTVTHDLHNQTPYNRKSVTGDTCILIRGVKGALWHGRIEEYSWLNGDSVLSVDLQTKQPAWKKITGYLKHKNDKRLFRVETRSGRAVTVTEDHSLVTLDNVGDLSPIYPRDLVVNRSRLPIVLPPDGPECNGELTATLGELAGLYLSEGHIPPSQPNLICIASAVSERQQQIKDLFLAVGGENPFVNGGNVCCTHAKLAAWLVENFGELSHKKHMSTWVLQSPSIFREGLIRGYFAGDGCLWADANGAIQLSAVSTSKKLRSDLVLLLGTLGIFATKFAAPREHINKNWHDGFGLRIMSGHLSKLSCWFFYADRECKFRQLLREKYRASIFELLPVEPAARPHLYAEYPGRVSKYIYKTARKGAVAKHRLLECSGNFGQWARSSVLWDRVTAVYPVSDSQEFVYDLAVEDSEIFAVDHGLLVHNTYIHNTPMVAVGDQVRSGQLLAKSNYTDDAGAVALGLNGYTAFMPWKGANFEDAVVISESMAKRLSSEHLYQHELDWTDETMQRGKKAFVSLFPGTLTREELGRYDDDGLIHPGETVREGDPLILAAKGRSEAANKVHKKGAQAFSDASVTWDHRDPGLVTDVAMTDSGPVVNVKAISSTQVGDKLCYDEKTEILTTDGWIPAAQVTMQHQICCLSADQQIQYLPPEEIYHYASGGTMYRIKSQQVDLFVTAEHRMYVQKRGKAQYELLPAKSIYGRRVRYLKSGRWDGASPETIRLVGASRKVGQGGRGDGTCSDVVFSTKEFLLLLGCYLSEGSTFWQPASGSYGIDLCQMKPAGRQRLIQALTHYGIRFCDREDRLRIYSKTLADYFQQFGKSYAKFIPAEIFTWGREDLAWFLHWLMWGDGHTHKTGRYVNYATVSKQLADDVQQLCLHIGIAANIKQPVKAGWQVIKGRKYWCRQKYSVQIVSHKLRPTVNHSHTRKQRIQEEFFVQDYAGPVYCVTVPTGVLYVRRNGIPVWSGNSGRYGNKGVVAAVIPDNQMPRDQQGTPFEVLMNPLGTISRGNPAAVIEAVLGKIAKKTGRPYKIRDFEDIDSLVKFARNEMRTHGVRDLEDVIHPETDMRIPRVLTGNSFYMKLQHTAESKYQGRSSGAYSSEERPAKGGDSGAKRLALMESNALISHGAYSVLRDARITRGQRNDEYWQAFMKGDTPTQTKVPQVWEKYLGQMKSAGINIIPDGPLLHVMALTNKDIKELAGDRTLQNAGLVDFDDKLSPVNGGLFDTKLTGGHGGRRWSKIQLTEPMPSPVMQDPIRRVLGLTEKQFLDVIAGKEQLGHGTGPKAIAEALDKIDIDKEIHQARQEVFHGRKSYRAQALKKLGYLGGAKRMGLHPRDWMLDSVPVLPPIFRPVSLMQTSNTPLVADPNYLYGELFSANKNLASMKQQLGEDVGEERLAVYNAFKAVTGLGDPLHPKLVQKGVRGVLKEIFGNSSPKYSALQQKLIGATVDNVGRGVIVPDSQLDMDSVGIPESLAWPVYRRHVLRRLRRDGMPLVQALHEWENRTPLARKAITDEMDARPVIISRAPVLHKYGILAFRPRLTKGDTIKVSPLIVSGFGADFDGDQMNFHVPQDQKAVNDAYNKLLPSRSLISPADFKRPVHMPSREFAIGLLQASQAPAKGARPRIFATRKDAMQAWRRGEIDVRTPVTILE